jgi:hypothetical protein
MREIVSVVALLAAFAVPAFAQPQRQQPPQRQPAPSQQPQQPASQQPQAAPVLNTCDYIDVKDAATLLGNEATATTAPSKGALLSCGYTSPSGNALTVSIADYGVPSIAQQFFEKTWELTKTATVEDSLGVSGFAVVTANPPPAPGRVAITALKAEKIVTLEASGPTAGTAQAVPALRALMLKVLAKIQPTPPPPQP